VKWGAGSLGITSSACCRCRPGCPNPQSELCWNSQPAWLWLVLRRVELRLGNQAHRSRTKRHEHGTGGLDAGRCSIPRRHAAFLISARGSSAKCQRIVPARQLALQSRVRVRRRHRRSLLSRLEQADRSALDDYVYRPPGLGTCVTIIGTWYYSAESCRNRRGRPCFPQCGLRFTDDRNPIIDADLRRQRDSAWAIERRAEPAVIGRGRAPLLWRHKARDPPCRQGPQA
jgi:hypothetical protein